MRRRCRHGCVSEPMSMSSGRFCPPRTTSAVSGIIIFSPFTPSPARCSPATPAPSPRPCRSGTPPAPCRRRCIGTSGPRGWGTAPSRPRSPLPRRTLMRARHDPADVRALGHDAVQNRVEPLDPAVLSFDPSELHGDMLRHGPTMPHKEQPMPEPERRRRRPGFRVDEPGQGKGQTPPSSRARRCC